MYLASLSRSDEALSEMARAQQLDPFSLIGNVLQSWVFYLARRYTSAFEQARKASDLDANFHRAHWMLGLVDEQQGKYEEAAAEFQRGYELSGGSPEYLAWSGHAYALAGKRAEARRIVAELTALAGRRYISAYDIAEIYVALGEKDQAFIWLEKALEERPRFIANLKVEPKLDSLRSDPRFTELMRRVGLTP